MRFLPLLMCTVYCSLHRSVDVCGLLFAVLALLLFLLGGGGGGGGGQTDRQTDRQRKRELELENFITQE